MARKQLSDINMNSNKITNLPTTPAGTNDAASKAYVDTKEPALPAGGNSTHYLRGDKTWQTLPTGGTGDVTGPASSVVGNIATFSTIFGKTIQDSGKSLPSGAIVGTTDTQTLTNKTLTTPTINDLVPGSNFLNVNGNATGNVEFRHNNADTGSVHFLTESFYTAGVARASFQFDRAALTFAMGGASNVSTIIKSGAVTAQTISTTGVTTLNVIGNSAGNAVSTDGTQTLTNKTLTSAVLSGTLTGTYTLGGTPTFPASVVLTTGAQTLASKTLTAPLIGTSIAPSTTDTATLGTSALQFSDIYLADGGIIDWNNGDLQLTKTGTRLQISGTTGAVFRLPSTGGLEFSSDTAITRSSAGVIAVGSVVVPTISSTNTLTNKDITDNTNTVPFRRVIHGATAGTARPNATYVEWVGSVAPTNANTTNDTWIDTT